MDKPPEPTHPISEFSKSQLVILYIVMILGVAFFVWAMWTAFARTAEEVHRQEPPLQPSTPTQIEELKTQPEPSEGPYDLVTVEYSPNVRVVTTEAPEPPKTTDTTYEPVGRATLLAALNKVRADNGVAPVTQNSLLDTSATLKAKHMVKEDYWSHNAPDGTTPWHWFGEAGYYYADAGENLARCFTTTENAINAWVKSPTHFALMIDPVYKEAGFGMSMYNSGCLVIVNHFGVR